MFQLGGSDQLGNFDAGAHLIKSLSGKPACGVCLPILTDGNHRKIGKSTANRGDPVWLSATRTSPFHLYQYFRQMHDDVAELFFTYFSLKPFEDVQAIVRQHNADKSRWTLQKALAEEVVVLVHGKDSLDTIIKCSNVLYDGLFLLIMHCFII